MKRISDKELFQLITKGDKQAFTLFYEKHWDSLYISAFKVLKDEEVCKDVVQDIFLGIWEKDDLGMIENIEAYLHQSIRYKVLMQIRKGKVVEKYLKTITLITNNTVEELISYQESTESVNQSLKNLPKKCGEVFRLSRIENLSNKEIAKKLGISVRTVETHISNALKLIRASLDISVTILMVFFF